MHNAKTFTCGVAALAACVGSYVFCWRHDWLVMALLLVVSMLLMGAADL